MFTAFQCFGVEISIADLTVLAWSLCPSLFSSDLSSYTACKDLTMWNFCSMNLFTQCLPFFSEQLHTLWNNTWILIVYGSNLYWMTMLWSKRRIGSSAPRSHFSHPVRGGRELEGWKWENSWGDEDSSRI